MDLQRTLSPWQRWRRHATRPALLLLLVLGTAGAGYALRQQADGAELTISARGISIATVERGPLALDVRGSGVLLPRDLRWIAAQSEARVERLVAQAGSRLKKGELLLVLSNPQLLQRAQESRWQLEQAQAELKALGLSLSSQAMNQRAAAQRAEFAARSAELQWQADQELLKDGMVSKLAFQRSRFSVEQSQQTLQLERELLLQHDSAMQAQLDAKRAAIARLHKAWERDLELVEALQVRAPEDGVLQELTLQPGQSVAAGSNLAKLSSGDALYAELQIQEAQARDIAIGQSVTLDLRTGDKDGVLSGTVSRVAPKLSNGLLKIDVSILGQLPRGARPDLNVDGVIALTRLADALQVQRPVFSQAMSRGHAYRLIGDDLAERISVQYGPASVGRIAIADGLKAGERIVVSDTSAWGQNQRVRLR
ncbi:HlyD family efflux transporter periplasmic adaptor subunit [Paucibacter sp. APW11]|uniref:HlyD family efflux transporter periplasmic adaptor subunit n=1 Tax=Roseateles aquae TaxID=3077235 RepID=A0ABU3P8Q9_9BURK|nr:HlyD family efflux transporter periplasmic adaptor subunit [Paucibacter sp. APW11]MDT8998961.1 HlyD family efflux transporter periplasmic adaptor subunit [Paucibacter sp. APW11]